MVHIDTCPILGFSLTVCPCRLRTDLKFISDHIGSRQLLVVECKTMIKDLDLLRVSYRVSVRRILSCQKYVSCHKSGTNGALLQIIYCICSVLACQLSFFRYEERCAITPFSSRGVKEHGLLDSSQIVPAHHSKRSSRYLRLSSLAPKQIRFCAP